MIIEICSGINADYLRIDGKDYYYGYDISKYPGIKRHGELIPTIEEIISKADDVIVRAGLNKFTGELVSEDDVNRFIDKYIREGGNK